MRGLCASSIIVTLLTVGVVLALSNALASAPATNSLRASAAGTITMMATADYQFQPATLEQVPTNATIAVTFTDTDNLPHSFTISSREGFVIPPSYTSTQLNSLFTDYPPLFSSLASGLGNVTTGTFQSPTLPGWYEFVCNVSGHFQNGMYGFIAFGENLPSNLTAPDRVGIGGTQVSPVEAAAAGGVVLVVVLALVARHRHRPPRGRFPEPVQPSHSSPKGDPAPPATDSGLHG